MLTNINANNPITPALHPPPLLSASNCAAMTGEYVLPASKFAETWTWSNDSESGIVNVPCKSSDELRKNNLLL